jgi:response regulator NasT
MLDVTESNTMVKPESEESVLPSLEGKRIVLCEDEGTTQFWLQRVAHRAGMLVVGAAGDGKSVVEMVRGEQPDLIVMDINMPIMDGLEATRQILAEGPACIVILTAYSAHDFSDEARKAGVSGYVTKPIGPDALIHRLQEAYKHYCVGGVNR